jgi:transaldolase
LSKSTAPVARKLSPEMAAATPMDRLKIDEKNFRWRVNEDAMATEKTAEGIRLFAADTVKLEQLIASKLGK